MLDEKEFLFGTRKPLFLGMHRFHFPSEASWKAIAFCIYLFISFQSLQEQAGRSER